MNKEKVTIYMDQDRVLYARKSDGTEYRLNIFDGGGYYTALMPQTEQEIEESKKARELSDKKFAEAVERMPMPDGSRWPNRLINIFKKDLGK